ncbi:MAG: peptide-methionine (R)-S-oxide reductase MsrB [Defluviicoccus sp.]|nr:peptide-methionine (R)-S-oxide reductase MsrB [Defluviicoccus sp.]MDE0382786.1 peptide-methionine (R)-S-oxide reductase MsrB [Defluviicoccus sp.]
MATETKAGKVEKTDEEWQAQLTPEQYAVTRQHATERPFSGEYDGCKDAGIYVCVCCGQKLFESKTKFNSGTGWPSFYQPHDSGAVGTTTDRSLFMVRTEVHCARCDAHLGHVFPDGPMPTGQRYCINSLSLRLDREDG